jgi:hypothetical protein
MIYEIADLRVNIQNRLRYTDNFCKEYLSQDQESATDFSVFVTDEAFREEKAQSPNFSDGYIENICLYREICLKMPLYNRFLLHSCVLEYKGNAYAFLGRSGTGKSTHTGLWLQYVHGSEILNGDKPILGVDNDQITVYGTPWMGKEGRGKKGAAPLKALVFLEQAKVNEIEKLSLSAASMRLFQQVLFPSEEGAAAKSLELLDSLVMRVPSYLLKCDISETAVKTSFECLTEKKYENK